MMSPLSHWQEFLLVALAMLSAIYVFYFRIWLALAIGSDILFCIALATSVASVAIPAVFETLAQRVIEQSPLPAALASADTRVAELASLPSDLIDEALARIGYAPEEDPVTEPTSPDSERAMSAPHEVGPFTSTVRPSVESLVGGVLRGAGFICGGFLMLTSLAMRSSSTTAKRLQELADRLDAIETLDA